MSADVRAVRIWLPGPPRGKGRPRFARTGHAYTPEKTRSYEAALRLAAQHSMAGRAPMAGDVHLVLEARFSIPRSWPKPRRNAAVDGHLRPSVKPDADNLLKMIDALNGVVWADDKQVVEATVRKRYSDAPGLLVEISEFSVA